MNFDDVNLVDVFINWFPMLALLVMFYLFIRQLGPAHVKNVERLERHTVALERIAAALEKRA
jgi:hypothetical protein